MSAAPQGPPPPPSSGGAATGSPFGRFPTQLLGLVAVAAAGIAAVSFSLSGGGNNAAPVPSGFTGSWQSPGMGLDTSPLVTIDSTGERGTLTVGACTGSLRRVERASDPPVFAYTDTSGERGCPRRLRVTVSLADRDTLELDARRPGGRRHVSAKLRRR